jgi:hypothetical protein
MTVLPGLTVLGLTSLKHLPAAVPSLQAAVPSLQAAVPSLQAQAAVPSLQAQAAVPSLQAAVPSLQAAVPSLQAAVLGILSTRSTSASLAWAPPPTGSRCPQTSLQAAGGKGCCS